MGDPARNAAAGPALGHGAADPPPGARVELELASPAGRRRVHRYEIYRAPLTGGRVTLGFPAALALVLLGAAP